MTYVGFRGAGAPAIREAVRLKDRQLPCSVCRDCRTVGEFHVVYVRPGFPDYRYGVCWRRRDAHWAKLSNTVAPLGTVIYLMDLNRQPMRVLRFGVRKRDETGPAK